MSNTPRHDPTLDAMIEAEVTEALRPYEGVYASDELVELRHMMRIALRTHPTAKHLLAQLRPRVAPDESGKEDIRAFNGASRRAQNAKKAGS